GRGLRGSRTSSAHYSTRSPARGELSTRGDAIRLTSGVLLSFLREAAQRPRPLAKLHPRKKAHVKRTSIQLFTILAPALLVIACDGSSTTNSGGAGGSTAGTAGTSAGGTSAGGTSAGGTSAGGTSAGGTGGTSAGGTAGTGGSGKGGTAGTG